MYEFTVKNGTKKGLDALKSKMAKFKFVQPS